MKSKTHKMIETEGEENFQSGEPTPAEGGTPRAGYLGLCLVSFWVSSGMQISTPLWQAVLVLSSPDNKKVFI